MLKPAYQELIRQAAQGEVVHNDDTTMNILTMMPARSPTEECAEEKSERTGVFTSGVVSTREGRRIALFFTGRKHAGENLAAVLSQRVSELGPPIQMCDALSRNPPKEFQVILANCIAHYPESGVIRRDATRCRHVDEKLRLAEVRTPDNLHRLSRNARSFGDGCHLFGARVSPARFQKASRTSRFICKLVVM